MYCFLQLFHTTTVKSANFGSAKHYFGRKTYTDGAVEINERWDTVTVISVILSRQKTIEPGFPYLLQSPPTLSTPAISTLLLPYRVFHSLVFHSCVFSASWYFEQTRTPIKDQNVVRCEHRT